MIVGALARLASLAAMVVVSMWVGRLLRGGFRGPGGQGPGGAGRRAAAPAAGEPMVRDRVCNTFLPRDRALRLDHAGQTHYFCSDACRGRFQASN